MPKPIRIVLAERRRTLQRYLLAVLHGLPGIAMIETTQDESSALRSVIERHPDVLLLSLDLPKMDGSEVLTQVMLHHPTPVICLDESIGHGSTREQELRDLGALFLLRRPSILRFPEERERFAIELQQLIERAARTRSVRLLNIAGGEGCQMEEPAVVLPTPDVQPHRTTPPRRPGGEGETAEGAILIGASTGGPNAIGYLLSKIPAEFCLPILIAQHMPKGFTEDLARHLNAHCPLEIRQCRDEDQLQPGLALLAPGKSHMRLRSRSQVVLDWPENPSGCCPSVDMLFSSGAEALGARSLAVVLTGMGNDGTRGARQIKQAGGTVIAQSEASASIFGMPRAAIEAGCVDTVADLDGILHYINAFAQEVRGSV